MNLYSVPATNHMTFDFLHKVSDVDFRLPNVMANRTEPKKKKEKTWEINRLLLLMHAAHTLASKIWLKCLNIFLQSSGPTEEKPFCIDVSRVKICCGRDDICNSSNRLCLPGQWATAKKIELQFRHQPRSLVVVAVLKCSQMQRSHSLLSDLQLQRILMKTDEVKWSESEPMILSGLDLAPEPPLRVQICNICAFTIHLHSLENAEIRWEQYSSSLHFIIINSSHRERTLYAYSRIRKTKMAHSVFNTFSECIIFFSLSIMHPFI